MVYEILVNGIGKKHRNSNLKELVFKVDVRALVQRNMLSIRPKPTLSFWLMRGIEDCSLHP